MSIIMTADIGGTNCRLGLFEVTDTGLRTIKTVWSVSGDIHDTAEFAEVLEKKLEMPIDHVDALVAAIAGPVFDGKRGRLSNGSLSLDFETLGCAHKNTRFALINDFTAQALAALGPANGRHIHGAENGPENGRRAIIGAGTGLGYASMHFLDGRWLALPSENGHAAFPFMDGDELLFGNFLCGRLGRPFASGDDVLAGRGLESLHLYLTGEKLAAPEIGVAALSGDTETLRWYSRFYGRACAAWILATLCTGGLWISGGIAARNPLCVSGEYFENELYADPQWRDFLKAIPVFLLEDKNCGLHGAARLGAELCGHKF